VLCYIALLFALLCMRMILRVQGLLRESRCLWAGPRRFWATLLLRTIRIISQRLGRVSGVAAYTQTNNETNQERLY